MATAIDRGLNRHWSGSLLDLAASCQDNVEQPCDILLNLGWKSEAPRLANSRFCDKSASNPSSQPINGQYRVGAAIDSPGPSNASINSCGDAGFLVGLFNAISNKDYKEATAENSKLQYSSGFTSNMPPAPVNLSSLCPRNPPSMSHPRLRMAATDDSLKRMRRRHCHSESELGPQVAFGNRSLNESVRQFFSLITLSSCFDTTGRKPASCFAEDDDSPELHVSGDLVDSERVGEKDDAESSIACQELLQPMPNVTSSIDEEPISPTAIQQQLKENCPPKSSLDELLTLPPEGLNLQNPQYDSPANCDDEQTFHSLHSTLSNRSSSAKIIKSVSFADDLGKSLTEVFEFDSTADKLPDYQADTYGKHYDRTLYGVIRRSKLEEKFYPGRFTRSRSRNRPYGCYSDYYFSSDSPEVGRYSEQDTRNGPAPTDKQVPIYVWNITFLQPATKYYEFRQKVESNAVSLENISVMNPDDSPADQQLPNLSGTVKVLNLAYQKQVWLRVTVDGWQTFTEHQAIYSQLLSGGHLQTPTRFDTFTFQVSSSQLLEPLAVSPDRIKNVCKIEFAIRYTVDDGAKQYWDNNGGKNYIIERSQKTADPINHSPQCTQLASPSLRRDSHGSHCFPDYRTTIDDVNDPYTAEYLPNFSGVTSFTDYRVWNHFVDETVYY